MQKKIFHASIDQLAEMMKWIHKVTEAKYKDKKKQIRQIELACEEALVNIISYAYPSHKGLIEIQIDTEKKQRVVISIIDQGKFFNPLLGNVKINPNVPLEDRKIGGLGILMIRKVMDEVHYKRVEESNVLTLVKKIY